MKLMSKIIYINIGDQCPLVTSGWWTIRSWSPPAARTVHSEEIWGLMIAWVTVGHLGVTVGHFRATAGHLRVIKGPLRVRN